MMDNLVVPYGMRKSDDSRHRMFLEDEIFGSLDYFLPETSPRPIPLGMNEGLLLTSATTRRLL